MKKKKEKPAAYKKKIWHQMTSQEINNCSQLTPKQKEYRRAVVSKKYGCFFCGYFCDDISKERKHLRSKKHQKIIDSIPVDQF